ncbi:MAG: MerR family transcriptional regulator [Lachnospiraceae bacterium]
MNDDKFYTIGEVSAISKVPIKTLRYYDDINLIIPIKRSDTGNYRYYRENQVLSLFIIRKLKLLGFALKEIHQFIEDSDVSNLQNIIDNKLDSLQLEISKLQNCYTEGQYFKERLKRGHYFLNEMDTVQESSACKIEMIPEVDVIYTRKVQTNYNNADVSIERWTEMFDLAKENELKTIGAITLTYHNEPLNQFYKTECDLEVCLRVDEPIDSPICKKFGGVQAVTAIHVGSHGTIYNTHINAIKWINKNNLIINGPISEEYIISPMDVMNEDAFLSKVIIPVSDPN